MSKSLETRLEEAFKELGITENREKLVRANLESLKGKDKQTYRHSVRVGLLGIKVAKYTHEDPEMMFLAGVYHDSGKLLASPEILEKTNGFDEADMKEMKTHVVFGYRMLRGIEEIPNKVAEIIVRHHQYGEDPYPKSLPELGQEFSNAEMVEIGYLSRLLALIDFYDSAENRRNDKFSEDGRPKKLSPKEVKEVLLAASPDKKILIESLYKEKILGE